MPLSQNKIQEILKKVDYKPPVAIKIARNVSIGQICGSIKEVSESSGSKSELDDDEVNQINENGSESAGRMPQIRQIDESLQFNPSKPVKDRFTAIR